MKLVWALVIFGQYSSTTLYFENEISCEESKDTIEKSLNRKNFKFSSECVEVFKYERV